MADRDDLVRDLLTAIERWGDLYPTPRVAEFVGDYLIDAGYTRLVRDIETLTDDEAAEALAHASRMEAIAPLHLGTQWERDHRKSAEIIRRLVRDVKPETESEERG